MSTAANSSASLSRRTLALAKETSAVSTLRNASSTDLWYAMAAAAVRADSARTRKRILPASKIRFATPQTREIPQRSEASVFLQGRDVESLLCEPAPRVPAGH